MTGPEQPSLGGIGRDIHEQIDRLDEMADTSGAWERLPAAVEQAKQAVEAAIGALAAVASIATDELAVPAADGALQAQEAGAIFSEVARGSNQESVKTAATQASAANLAALAETGHATAIADTARNDAGSLQTVLANLEYTERISKGAEVAAEKLGHRNNAAEAADEYAQTL